MIQDVLLLLSVLNMDSEYLVALLRYSAPCVLPPPPPNISIVQSVNWEQEGEACEF